MIPIEKSDERLVGRYILSSYRMLKKNKDFFNELNNFVYDQFCGVKRSDSSIIFENRERSMLKLLTLNYSDLRLIKDKIDSTVNKDFEVVQEVRLKVKNVLKLVYKYLASNVLLEYEEWYVKNKDVLTKEVSKNFEVSTIITSYVIDRQLKKIRKKIQQGQISSNSEINSLLNKFEDSKKYINFLVDNIDENFKDNLDKFVRDNTKDGYDLRDFLGHTLTEHSEENLFNNSAGNFSYKTDLKNYLVFKYKEEFSKIYDKIDKKELVRITGVTVCPYCNRNFVNVTNEANTSQLDHFFPKSEYPLFALCFYNLIPSCYGCNNKKSNKHFNISPYDETIGNMDEFIKFSYEISNADFFTNKNSIQVIIKEVDNDLFDDKQLLDLPNLYRLHNDVVQEILWKSSIYTKGYRDSIDKLLNPIPEVLRKMNNKVISKDKIIKYITDDDINRIITGVYTTPKDYGKRPLSKMVTDISKEIGLIGDK